MIRRTLHNAIHAGRPPRPVRIIEAETLPRLAPSAQLSIGRSVDSALSRLSFDAGPRTLLIPDRRAAGRQGLQTTPAAISWLNRTTSVTIGVPSNLTTTERRRWDRLASGAGAGLNVLGSIGWNRVRFGDRSLVLEDADYPVELFDDAALIMLSEPAGAGCLARWAEIVHPNSALRARVSGNAVVELSAAVDVSYLLVGQFGSLWLAAVATPAIVAELMARGYERLRERRQGVETTGPWEDVGVQHLSELGEAGPLTTNLVLRAALEDNAGGEIARRLAEMLGWQLAIVDDRVGGADE